MLMRRVDKKVLKENAIKNTANLKVFALFFINKHVPCFVAHEQYP